MIRQHGVVGRFAAACRLADTATMQHLLTPDAIAVLDGVEATAHGPADVTRLVELVLCARPATELTMESVNGHPGLALRRAGRALAVVAVQVTAGRVAALWIVNNPAKLLRWHQP